jgi:hypothetical protein
MHLTAVVVLSVPIRASHAVNLSLRIELMVLILAWKDTDSVAALGDLIELVQEVRVVGGSASTVKLFVFTS